MEHWRNQLRTLATEIGAEPRRREHTLDGPAVDRDVRIAEVAQHRSVDVRDQIPERHVTPSA
ncbi:hypothetical protein [Streptomyces sp. NPDC005568]|uniref:hypothetical protein n=1 Tax=Streptomyces sp. NPDC005568 TaxID=3156887 RepID=UPI0033AB860C